MPTKADTFSRIPAAGLVLAAALCLTACATAPTSPDVDARLHAMIGHKVREAVALFGRSRTIHPIRGGMIYSWNFHEKRKHGGTALSRQQNETGAEIAAALQQNPNAVKPPPTCNLTMVASREHTIISFHLTGDSSQCGPLRATLSDKK